MAVRPNSASTLLILTSGPNSQALSNNTNSIADPMMPLSTYHRQSQK